MTAAAFATAPVPMARFYKAGPNAHDIEPVLDGRPVRDAVRWQEGSFGWVEVYKIDESGNVERDIFERPITQRINGYVTTRRIQY
jgi:hypothetical protein